MRIWDRWRLAGRVGRSVGVLCLGLGVWTPTAAQEPVGRIEGDDIAVKGQVTLVRAGTRKSAELASGSEVSVRTGQARLTLNDGSEIDICGPAQFTVLRSGDAVTVALNHGRLHGRFSPTLPVTIYTPLVVFTPIAIEGRPRDSVIGLDAGGEICVQPVHGAARLEQQLTGASIVVPQSGEMILPEGQLESMRQGSGNCRCDVVLMEDLPQLPPARVATIAARPLANPEETPKPPATEEPRWTVVMPPLTFDAKSPGPPPEPKPETATLIREIQVRPTVVFQGKVEAEAAPKQTQRFSEPKKGGFLSKVGGFFRRLFGGKSKSS